MISKAQATKAKIDKWDYKLKNFHLPKETVKKQKLKWERIFANHVF